jgi:N-acetylmuramoyl-L-alanine amidase
MVQAIFIEAGHGRGLLRRDPGACSGTLTERSINVDLSRRIIAYLKARPEMAKTMIVGVGVETEATLGKKTAYIREVVTQNKLDPSKCFGISMHVNGNYNVSGIEGYFQKRYKAATEAGPRLMSEILIAVKEYFQSMNIRRVMASSKSRYGRLYIDDIPYNQVLLETGFIGNVYDKQILLTQQDRYVEAIVHGLFTYFRLNKLI